MIVTRQFVRSFALWWMGCWAMIGLLAWAQFGSFPKACVAVWVPIALGIYWLTLVR